MKRSSGIFLPILLTLSASFASAAEVYTWVDDSGVTHFSEKPPAERTRDAQLIEVMPTAAPASSVDDDFYSVINQADRMEARRLENEKLAAEKKQADAEASKARAEAAAIRQGAYNDSGSDTSRYYPVYPYYPRYGHHPGRPGYGHHPGRPGYGHKPVYPVYPGYARPKNPRTSLGKTPGMPGQRGSWR
ncbi:MAG: DUF4124 domain-containing protein [Gammaproteobacteria bacterium]|jgi:hypothetical protein